MSAGGTGLRICERSFQPSFFTGQQELHLLSGVLGPPLPGPAGAARLLQGVSQEEL